MTGQLHLYFETGAGKEQVSLSLECICDFSSHWNTFALQVLFFSIDYLFFILAYVSYSAVLGDVVHLLIVYKPGTKLA